MSLTKVSYSMIQGSEINVFDFMSAAQIADITSGTGAVRCDVQIQACIDAVQAMKNRPTIVFPVGKYRLEAGLVISVDCMSLFGLGMPSIARGDDSSSTTRGPTLRYYGTGTALKIGIAPDVNGDFIYETNIQNLRIEVDNTTSCAMRVWHSAVGYFKNISIFGNKGNNIGLFVNAGISNIYEQIFINGQGQTPGANTSEYLGAGMRLTLGFGNDLATTTIFRRCYITSCNRGVLMDYRYDFEDTVFESCAVGVESISYMVSNFTRCWWEANVTRDVVFSSGADGDTAIFRDCLINSLNRQAFFSTGAGVQQVMFSGCQIVTGNANPELFLTGVDIVRSSSPAGLLTLNNNRFATNTILGGIEGSSRASFPLVQNNDQKLCVYRFIQKAITSGFTGTMDTSDAIAGDAFVMPRRGNLVAANVWYTGSLGGGSWSIETKVNGTNVAGLSFPTVPVYTTEPEFVMCDPMKYEVAATNALTLNLTTSGFSGGDFIVEVYVLHGSSGRP
jgi:hypothetical protein